MERQRVRVNRRQPTEDLAADERLFILDEQRSALERLEPSERDRYLGFAWNAADFPGGPTGPNEDRADRMFAALTRLRPERRANQGETAAVRASEFDAAMQSRMRRALVAVPGEQGIRLHRDASASYVQMRTAASADGVTLTINNAYRAPAVAQANAARADNRLAVAAFSSHTLGLAIDLNMSHGGLRFAETSTRPFRNLVGMYASPVYKWMFLRGESHGWFPYRREPWHWEYNPPGLRERLRATPSEPASAAPTESDEQAVSAPIAAIRPPLAIKGSVGRGGRNAAADVLAVQQRLIELHLLEQSDAAAERPSGQTAEASLPRTIDAIERFQGSMGTAVDGKVDVTSPTRTDLDRAIPSPTAADFTAVAAARNSARVAVSRGLTLTGPVGSTASGNAPDDVRGVQRRLVDLGRLPATHRESPAASSGAVSQANLRATIQALRAVQSDARFWIARGAFTGAITPGVVAPGDGTAAFLDRVSAWRIAIGPHEISFHDHVASSATQSETGVMSVGTVSPSAIPVTEYQALGVSAGQTAAQAAAQAAALKFVSNHEGNFDAINTYDRALVSAGFIQFAGSRGLPPYLALLKARQPAKFRDLLQKFGIDVEFTVAGAAIGSARVIVLDPASSSIQRGAAAESAIRNDKTLTAALSVSGRDRDVQLAQIEAALRDYVRPALDAPVSWAANASARLGQLLRSKKGMAALFDRAIQEGLVAARRRFERLLQRLVRGASRSPSLAEMQRREGDVLSELERDLQAAADVAARVTRARAALQTMIAAAAAAGAAVAPILARPELAVARRAIADARSGLAGVVNVAPSRNVTVDATLAAMAATLSTEDARLALTPIPASLEALTSQLTTSRQALATVAGPVATSPMFLARVQRIRRSTLDSGLTEAV